MKILKNKWFWLLIIIVVIIASIVFNSNQPAQTVQVYEVTSGAVDLYVEDSAVVKADDAAVQYAELSGVVEQIDISVGDQVKQGQLLLTFDSSELQSQLDELLARKEGFAAGRAELVDPDNDSLQWQLSSAVSKASSNLSNVNRQLENQRLLYQSGAASLESVRQLEALSAAAASDLSAARAALSQAQQGGSDNMVDQADSQLQAIDAQIERLNNQLAKSEVVAALDGIVVSKNVADGQFVPIGTPLLEVENVTAIKLETMLLAEDIVDLSEGAEVEILRDDAVIANGTVRQIYPKAVSTISDLGVEQKRVKVLIDVSNSELKLGYEYDIKVYVNRLEQLRIPDSAYFEVDGVGKVFVVENEKLQLKDVTVLFKGNDYYAVEGLTAGEQIVRSPGSKLEVDMKVAVE